MSRAEEHHWYDDKPTAWPRKQLDDYLRDHGFVVQRSDVVDGGIPTRRELDAMRAMPGKTDVPRRWIRELCKARDMLDEVEQLPDGSEPLNALVESAAHIEEEALERFERR
jgi:hypothetical protein